MKKISVENANVCVLSVKELMRKKKNGEISTQLLVDGENIQRNSVWNMNKKGLLIDSILRGDEGLIIPPLVGIQKGKVIEIADGQQRVLAIESFYQDKIRLNDSTIIMGQDISKKKYSKCPPQIQEKFANAPIVIYVTPYVSNKQTRELFVRNNSGEVLKPIEKTRVKMSDNLAVVNSIVKSDFFVIDIPFTKTDIKRFGNVDLGISLIMEEIFPGSDHNKSSKEKFVEVFENVAISNDIRDKIMHKVSFLHKAFKGEAQDEKQQTLKKVLAKANRVLLYRVVDEFKKNGMTEAEVLDFLKDYFINKEYTYSKVAGTTSTSNKTSLDVRYGHMVEAIQAYKKHTK